jgi:hypothetical protein
MKHVFTFLALIAFVGGQFVRVVDNKYCRRVIASSLDNVGTTFTATADASCRSDNNSGRAERLVFVMSARPVPTFKISSLARSSDTTASFSVRYAIDKVVEYVEMNGIPGYQPSQDQLIHEYGLSGTIGNQWTSFNRNIINVNDDITVQSLTTSLGTSAGKFTFELLLTSDEVVSSAGSTKTVLTPNSFKTTFSINNFVYLNPSSRIAIGIVLFVKYGAVNVNTTSPPSADGNRPDDSTTLQSVALLPGNASQSGFFSWQRFVLGKSASGEVTKTVTLIETGFSMATDTVLTRESDEVGFLMIRNHYSIYDRISYFSWDPSLGVSEPADSPAPNPNIASSAASIYLQLLVIMITCTII